MFHAVPYGNHGCGGGNIANTFMYIINNGGVDLVKEYPYRGRVRAVIIEMYILICKIATIIYACWSVGNIVQ